jgi:hypothetical protein
MSGEELPPLLQKPATSVWRLVWLLAQLLKYSGRTQQLSGKRACENLYPPRQSG